MTRVASLTLSGLSVTKAPLLSDSAIGKTGYEFR